MNDTTPPNISQPLLRAYHSSMVNSADSNVTFDYRYAATFGINEGIILSILERLCKPSSKGGKLIDGERWIFNTYQSWHENYIKWLSPREIGRAILRLEKDGYVLSCQPDGFDKKKYYRSNEDKVMLAIAANFPEQFPGDDQIRFIDDTKVGMMENTKDGMFINSNNINSNTVSLSNDKDISQPEKKSKPVSEKKPRPRNPMFDMVAAITFTDIAVKSNASSVAKAARELTAAGYTPEDVEAFSKWWARNKKGFGKPPKPYQIAPDIKLALAGNVYDYTTLIKLPEEEKPAEPMVFPSNDELDPLYDENGDLLPW